MVKIGGNLVQILSFVHNIAKGGEGKEKREKLVSVPIFFLSVIA